VLQLMRGGAYKRRSVELFRTLPHTGRPYLRAVSLLGAATPEVKGLREVCFASQQDACTVEFAVEGGAAAVEEPQAVASPAPAIAPRLVELFSDLRRDGYCLPDADAAALQELFSAGGGADGGSNVQQFQENDDTAIDAGLACLSRIFRQALLKAPLGEDSAPTAAAAATAAQAMQFSDRVEPRSFALHQAAVQIMSAEPALSYRDALLRAGR
jgi:hypothetical protein